MIPQLRGRWVMENPSLVTAIGKLAIAGEQGGFSVEQMVRLLDDGLTVGTLLDVISWRLEQSLQGPAVTGATATWIH